MICCKPFRKRQKIIHIIYKQAQFLGNSVHNFQVLSENKHY